MSVYLVRTLRLTLPGLKSPGKRLYSVLRTVHPTLASCRRQDDAFPNRIGRPPFQYQCRHLSFESIANANVGLYSYVVTSKPSMILQYGLTELHDTVGLPWWATITLLAAGVRVFIGLPIGIFQNYTVAGIKRVNEEVEKLMPAMEQEILLEAKRGKWNNIKKNRQIIIRKEKLKRKMYIENNCHPLKIVILSLMYLPPWVLCSFTLRSMCYGQLGGPVSPVTLLELQSEGPMWSPDLTAVDPTLILPVMVTVLGLGLVDLNTIGPGKINKGFFAKFMLLLMKGITVLAFFISASAPSCLPLFWSASTSLAIVQNLCLMSPRVKKSLGMPLTLPGEEKPYAYFAKGLKDRYLSIPRFIWNLKK